MAELVDAPALGAGTHWVWRFESSSRHMGKNYEYNWVLVLNEVPNDLEVGKVYEFEKEEERIYPRGMSIELDDKDWNKIGKCEIIEFTISDNKTSGKYKLLELA